MQAASQNGVDLTNQPDFNINALLLQAESQAANQNDGDINTLTQQTESQPANQNGFSLPNPPNPAQQTTAQATNRQDVDINTLLQQMEPQVGNQDYIDLTASEQPGTVSAEQIPFPQLPSFEDQIDQLLNARAQEFFAANVRVQAELLSLHETMSANVDSADPSQVEPPTGRKKAQPRKRKTAAKSKSSNGTAPQRIQLQMPDQAQRQVATPQDMMTQMPVASFGLDQVMASDPFVSTSPQQGISNNGQGMFNTCLPGAAQMSSELVHAPVQQTAQQLSNYSAFMDSASNTPPQGSLSAPMSSSAQGSGRLTASPSSDNKRKASAAHTMESPTKRRQSVNQQGAVVAVAQSSPLPLPVGPQNSQITPPQRIQMSAPDLNTPPSSLGTPAQNFQTPVDVAVHFGISPPSGDTMSLGTAPFSTAAKAGITAAIKCLVNEVKRRGTALGQMLADGFQTNLAAPEMSARIKQLTKSCMADATATNPEDENHAFNCGAWKALHQIMQEMEQHGTALGKALLVGPLSGTVLVAVKQKMGDLFKEVAELYTSPPRFGTSSAQLAQPAQVQLTPTLAAHATTHLSQQTNAANMAIQTGSPYVPGYPLLSATTASGHAGVQQQSGHASPVTTTQAHPRMPSSNNNSSPMEGHPASVPAMNGSAEPSYQELKQQLQHIQQQRDQQLQQMMQMMQQQLQQQQTKKTSTPRKPRARKSSVAVSTPVTNSAARNTPSPVQGSVADSPGHSAPASNHSNNGQSAPGQYVPRIAYHFSDGTFYMQVGANNNGTGEASYRRIGAGTVAAQTALRQFLGNAQARGVLMVPPSFVLKLWLTTEQNLENLRRVLMGEGELFF
ncbi:uncharacterized protein B0T15DRAFT_236289 [Chaetomium strumarium]|uniref:Uncharacterized protein n=1 Tax=Chaetomium strumarium TaxID=1170767 RepID=A0AAJ0M0C2_9PEZI|nr:hypothetical protein B0T15DRAFT_236289 [Chaetomium strumarium]